MSNSPVVISHSEVESYLSCQRKHWYAFGDSTFGEHSGLEPKRFSRSLFRGLVGHEALGEFFGAIKNGEVYEVATQKAYDRLNVIGTRPEMLKDTENLTVLTDLISRILPRYFNSDIRDMFAQGWKPIHVEETFRLRMDFDTGSFVYPFKPDVIMRDPVGNNWVWDHKFVYNFYGPEEINLLPQLPKYIGSLRALDIPIKGGYYNMLRWRDVKDTTAHTVVQKFVPTDERIKHSFRQQYNVMVEIAKLKQGNPDEWRDNTTRVLSTMVCKHCSFKMLCAADMNDLDTTLMRRVEFASNSYGYTAESDE